MKKILFILVFSFIFCETVSAQNKQGKNFSIPKSASVMVKDINEDCFPSLQTIEMPRPVSENRLHAIKDSLSKVYPRKHSSALNNVNKNSQAVLSPVLNRNFLGNLFNNSTPNDNDIAVSNADKLISVMNTNIFKYDVGANSPLGTVSLSAFFTALGDNNVKFDPKVIYDPMADRFILVCLSGFTPATSNIMVGFSQTGDPNGTWHLYKIPGNPLNNDLWTDFPMISITEKEAFITVNLLLDSVSWQTGFVETIIWQINKDKGYNGQTLNSIFHDSIQYNGRNLRNLCPVKGGSYVYGPGMYFLSNRNFDAANDSIFLVHLTDTINAPAQALTVTHLTSNHSYFMPPLAEIPGSITQLLETNDARVLGAFIENDKIQFVSNCLDTASGRSGVFHGTIDNVSSAPVLTANIITDTLLEMAYPNISYLGINSTDNSAIISFDHSAKTVFPGVSALISDGNGGYSDLVTVKSGQSYYNVLSGNERWGDYSGSQRKYDEPGIVWINGMYGTSSYKHNTWIGELYGPAFSGIKNENIISSDEANLYPNPVKDIVSLEFYLNKPDYIYFEVYDINGKLVKTVLNERVKAGKNSFSFSSQSLPVGIYLLKVHGKEINLNKKFIRQ